MKRVIAALAVLVTMAACTNATKDLDGPLVPLGDFKLGHSEVVAPNLQKLLVSRDATKEEWITLTDAALEKRFRRFEGNKFYHLGVSVEGYSLPPPIVPGKSYLALRVTVWDDAAQAKINEEPELILMAQVFESRISSSREESMQRLVDGAAKLVEDWLREQQAAHQWFGEAVAAAEADAAAAVDAEAVAVEEAPADASDVAVEPVDAAPAEPVDPEQDPANPEG